MRILIATAFENSKDPFEVLALDYIRRTNGVFKPDLKQVKPEKLLDISKSYFRIILDEKGLELDSIQFSKNIQRLIDQSKPVAFLIGEPSGHRSETREKADAIWSLSKMTLPHKLALCVLAEQIYRAGEIARNGPYHK
ncbi:MAG: 23S rRNA (pseudouridine(1915)-N(3))-methyltransferase RlmH [Myxococcaceae bacterium]